MARNRKRAKERRARRPQPVAAAQVERDEPPAPTRHAAPDVELAEAQLAVGRPELVDDAELESAPELDDGEQLLDSEEPETPDPVATAGGRGARLTAGDGAVAPHPVERPGVGARLVNFLRGSWSELQRVQWPDRRQVIQATGVVIGFVIIAGVFLGIADQLAAKLVNFVLK